MAVIRDLFRKSWAVLAGERETVIPQTGAPAAEMSRSPNALEVDFDPSDPLLPVLLNAAGVVEISKLTVDSPLLASLKEAGVHISLPLVSQGELIGLLNLGPRLSEQEYSTDDQRLLNNLATQAAPALRVAQLVRQQRSEALELERLEQELRVARIIQQTLLPKDLPSLPGWAIKAHWQPAQAVSGDFYDYVSFPDGRLAVVVGDVTDKGVPAALVMATTRSILRAAAEHLVSPALVLREVNNQLSPNIPPNMFVTCLYALLDPNSGLLTFANAGHNLPYLCRDGQVREVRATGMPLGLLPNMSYEEKSFEFLPGTRMLLYSDGLVEAHDQQGEMFGFPRLQSLLEEESFGQDIIPLLLEKLASFTGPGWEQEDDVTFMTLERMETGVNDPKTTYEHNVAGPGDSRMLTKFSLPSQPGNERIAMERVAEAVKPLNLPPTRIENLKTAVAEGTMNAMEHGNKYQEGLVVEVEVLADQKALVVRITDQGGDQTIPKAGKPDLEAKLDGLQSPRGWGLFLIENMVDSMHIETGPQHHTLELVMHLQGGGREPSTI